MVEPIQWANMHTCSTLTPYWVEFVCPVSFSLRGCCEKALLYLQALFVCLLLHASTCVHALLVDGNVMYLLGGSKHLQNTSVQAI